MTCDQLKFATPSTNARQLKLMDTWIKAAVRSRNEDNVSVDAAR